MLFQEVCPHCQLTLLNEERCPQCGWRHLVSPAEAGEVVQAISWPEANFVRAGGVPLGKPMQGYLPTLGGDLFALKPGTVSPIAWHYRLPPHTYAPGMAQWGDYTLMSTVYVGGLPAPHSHLILLHSQTGKEVRRFNLSGSACNAPIVGDGIAYVLDNFSWLYAIDLTALKETGRRQLPTWA